MVNLKRKKINVLFLSLLVGVARGAERQGFFATVTGGELGDIKVSADEGRNVFTNTPQKREQDPIDGASSLPEGTSPTDLTVAQSTEAMRAAAERAKEEHQAALEKLAKAQEAKRLAEEKAKAVVAKREEKQRKANEDRKQEEQRVNELLEKLKREKAAAEEVKKAAAECQAAEEKDRMAKAAEEAKRIADEAAEQQRKAEAQRAAVASMEVKPKSEKDNAELERQKTEMREKAEKAAADIAVKAQPGSARPKNNMVTVNLDLGGLLTPYITIGLPRTLVSLTPGGTFCLGHPVTEESNMTKVTNGCVAIFTLDQTDKEHCDSIVRHNANTVLREHFPVIGITIAGRFIPATFLRSKAPDSVQASFGSESLQKIKTEGLLESAYEVIGSLEDEMFLILGKKDVTNNPHILLSFPRRYEAELTVYTNYISPSKGGFANRQGLDADESQKVSNFFKKILEEVKDRADDASLGRMMSMIKNNYPFLIEKAEYGFSKYLEYLPA